MTTRRHRRAIVAEVRLRVGVVLWLLSWVPYGIILGLEGKALTLAWAVEITLGLIGLGLAGSVFAAATKLVGWRHTPGVAWGCLRTGHAPKTLVAGAVVADP